MVVAMRRCSEAISIVAVLDARRIREAVTRSMIGARETDWRTSHRCCTASGGARQTSPRIMCLERMSPLGCDGNRIPTNRLRLQLRLWCETKCDRRGP